MKTIELDTPFAVFSDVHGNLPGLEAILADIEARGVPQTHLPGRPRRLWSFAQRGRPARARPGHPLPDGQLRPGHRLRDRRLRLRLQDRRAARRGRRLAGLDTARRSPTRSRPTCARSTTTSRCTPRAATCWRCTAARGASTSTCSKTGRRRRCSAWPTPTRTRRSSSDTRTCPMRDAWARPRSSTWAAAGARKTATGASATRSSTRKERPTSPASSSSCAWRTTMSTCCASWPRRR